MKFCRKMELVIRTTVLVALLHFGCAQYCVPSSCPGQQSPVIAEIPANTSKSDYFYIGGIFGVHYEGDNFYTCDATRERGIQNLEAFLWAVRTFRSRSPNILRDINVGAVAFDSCFSTDKSVQQILNLESCSVGYGSPVVEPNRLFAFIGPDRSKDALTLANVMAELGKPIVSHAATSPELSSPEYKYFLRTVPSDSEQVQAIMAVLNKQDWNYIQLVYTDDAYGKAGKDELEMVMEEAGKCVVSSYAISPSDPTEDEIEDLIEGLVENQKTRAVVLFTYGNIVKNILEGVAKSRRRGLFSWIGTTAWGDSAEAVEYLEEYAEGAITIMPDSSTPGLDSFKQYFVNLKPDTNKQNPWFKQYWREKFNCFLPGEPQGNYLLQCDLSTQSLEDVTLDPYVSYTIKAVDAVLDGVEGARSTSCPGLNSLCSGFINNDNKGDVILDHISRVQISGVIEFNKDTRGPRISKYDLLNYRPPGSGSSCRSLTEHCYSNVGSYDTLSKKPDFKDDIYSYDSQGQRLDTVSNECPSNPCEECPDTQNPNNPNPGTGGNSNTGAGQGNTGTGQGNTGTGQGNTGTGQGNAGTGQGNSGSLTKKLEPPPVKMRDDTWVIVLIILAGIGILLTIVFEIYLMSKIIGDPFIKHWRTMWLGQLLLLAVFLCYLTLFAFVPTPTKYTCGILRFGIGCSYAMCFSILLVKLMIILSSKSVGYLKGIFQVLMFIFAWGVQIVVDVEWLILRPPEVVWKNNTGVIEWVCKVDFEDHIQSLIYVMFLIIMCTLVAVKAHGIITNHREGIFIGLVAGFTISVWIGWILLGVFNDDDWQDPVLAFGLFITATLILFIMYLPKVRQLNSMGVEGIYAEDDAADYAPSLIQPSIVPPGSVIYGGPPSYRSKPASPGSVIYVDGVAGGGGGMYSEPNTIIKASHIHVEGDPNALFLKHPGVPRDSGYNTTPSVRSAPAGYVLRRNPNLSLAPTSGEDIHTNTRVLKMTNDLSGRHTPDRKAISEANFNVAYAPREGYSTLQYPTYKSKGSTYSVHSGTLKKPKSLQDLGSL